MRIFYWYLRNLQRGVYSKLIAWHCTSGMFEILDSFLSHGNQLEAVLTPIPFVAADLHTQFTKRLRAVYSDPF